MIWPKIQTVKTWTLKDGILISYTFAPRLTDLRLLLYLISPIIFTPGPGCWTHLLLDYYLTPVWTWVNCHFWTSNAFSRLNTDCVLNKSCIAAEYMCLLKTFITTRPKTLQMNSLQTNVALTLYGKSHLHSITSEELHVINLVVCYTEQARGNFLGFESFE